MLALRARDAACRRRRSCSRATDPGADYRNRIWMPHRRAAVRRPPVAGHRGRRRAARAASDAGDATSSRRAAGLQPIDVGSTARRGRASMLQEPAVFGDELDRGAGAGARSGLPAAEAAGAALPCQVVSTGLAQVIAPVGGADALARVRVRRHRLVALLAEHGGDRALPRRDRRRRRPACAASSPQDGLPRGPGHGLGRRAADGLPARPHAAWTRLAVTQGVEMRRRCRIDCRMEGDRVRVGGDVVVVFEARIDL